MTTKVGFAQSARFPRLHRSSRLAFTWIELVVVLVVIVLFIGLMMPATRTAREAARRMSCQSNLRQIGLGLLNYESSHKRLPAAWGGPAQLVDRPDQSIYIAHEDSKASLPPIGRWSSFIALLPHMEASTSYQSITIAYTDSDRKVSIAAPIAPWNDVHGIFAPWSDSRPWLRCPTDGDVPNRKSQSKAMESGRTNYAFCYGDTGVGVTNASDKHANRGAFQGRFGRRLSEIKDGISQTILMSEIVTTQDLQNGKRLPQVSGSVVTRLPEMEVSPDRCQATRVPHSEHFLEKYHSQTQQWRGVRWMDGAIAYTGFQTILPPNSANCSSGSDENDWGVYSASSFHGSSVTSLFADGSIRSIPVSIDAGKASQVAPTSEQSSMSDLPSPYGVWGALGTIASGDSVGDDLE